MQARCAGSGCLPGAHREKCAWHVACTLNSLRTARRVHTRPYDALTTGRLWQCEISTFACAGREARSAATQYQKYQCRHSARRGGGPYRRHRDGLIVAGFQYPVRQRAPAMSRVCSTLHETPVRSNDGTGRRSHRSVATGSGPSTASRYADDALACGKHDYAVQSTAVDAVFPGTHVSAASAHAGG